MAIDKLYCTINYTNKTVKIAAKYIVTKILKDNDNIL